MYNWRKFWFILPERVSLVTEDNVCPCLVGIIFHLSKHSCGQSFVVQSLQPHQWFRTHFEYFPAYFHKADKLLTNFPVDNYRNRLIQRKCLKLQGHRVLQRSSDKIPRNCKPYPIKPYQIIECSPYTKLFSTLFYFSTRLES